VKQNRKSGVILSLVVIALICVRGLHFVKNSEKSNARNDQADNIPPRRIENKLAEKKATISSSVIAPFQAVDASSGFETSAIHLESYYSDLSHVSRFDQKGLDRLRARAIAEIQKNPGLFSQQLKNQIPEIEKMPSRDAFFLVDLSIRALVHPELQITPLLVRGMDSPIVRINGDQDDPTPTPAEELNHLRAFALKKLSDLSWNSSAANPEFIQTLVILAKYDRDLAVVRESVHLLNTYTSNPSAFYSEIRAARQPNEIFAINDLISKN